MANEPKIIRKQNSVNSSKRKISRVNSFAKDEDMEGILQEIDSQSSYSPSSKNAKKRESIADGQGIPIDEELNQFFVDVEKRNAELQELLQAVESTRDEGNKSRITSAETTRGSTDSLVEKLMQELDEAGCEKDESNVTTDKRPKGTNKTKACSKLEASASEEELDQMLAELLELWFEDGPVRDKHIQPQR